MLKTVTAFLGSLILTAAATGQTPLTIDTSHPGPLIDSHIFGQFAEHLGTGIYDGVWVGPESPIPNTRGIRNDVVAALKELRVPDVRWPGGCFADRYNWRDGVGPREKRPRRINANWGGTIETNAFGTHEFMDFVEQIGSEAYVSINVGSGTPREAGEWLEYMTTDKSSTLGNERRANGREKPWKIRLLGLGNESWGCGAGWTGKHYAEEMSRYAIFATNQNPDQVNSPFAPPPSDPMLRIAVGPDKDDPSYTEAVMQAWKNRLPYAWGIEGLSLHSYTFGKEGIMQSPATGFGDGDYVALLKNSYDMDRLVTKHSAIMDRFDPGKEVALAVDEWGNWLKPMQGSNMLFLRQESSLRDAISAAVTLNIFARHAERVRVANIAQMVNVLQAMIMTDGKKMHLTPTYHLFRMYVPFQNATRLPVSLDGGTFTIGDITLPRIDALAARSTDGKIWLAVVNLDPASAAEVTLPGYASVSGETLTAPKIDSINSFDKPDLVKPVRFKGKMTGGKMALRLPAKSITVVQLSR